MHVCTCLECPLLSCLLWKAFPASELPGSSTAGRAALEADLVAEKRLSVALVDEGDAHERDARKHAERAAAAAEREAAAARRLEEQVAAVKRECDDLLAEAREAADAIERGMARGASATSRGTSSRRERSSSGNVEISKGTVELMQHVMLRVGWKQNSSIEMRIWWMDLRHILRNKLIGSMSR